MKKVLPFLLSSILTGSMAFGYFYGVGALIDFAVTFWWILIVLMIPISLMVYFSCASIDNGTMTEVNKKIIFDSFGEKRSFIKSCISVIFMVSNMVLLIASGYGVTACVYLIANGLAYCVRSAVIKRRVNDKVDNLHK